MSTPFDLVYIWIHDITYVLCVRLCVYNKYACAYGARARRERAT